MNDYPVLATWATSVNAVEWLNPSSARSSSGLINSSAHSKHPMRDGLISDDIYRVVIDTSSVSVFNTATSAFSEALRQVLANKDLLVSRLRSVVHWQRRRIDYQASHMAFLLGSSTEDEFLEEAEKFAYDPAELSAESLAEQIESHAEVFDFDMSPMDYADFFCVEVSTVMDALALKSKSRALEN